MHKRRDSLTLIAGVLTLLVGKMAIGYYIGHARVGSAYGAAGSLVVLLVWVYYSSLIFFFGAEFTHAWATRQHEVAPKSHAAPVQHRSTRATPLCKPRGREHGPRMLACTIRA